MGEKLSESSTRYVVRHKPPDPAPLMGAGARAVVAFGMTSLELACLGVRR